MKRMLICFSILFVGLFVGIVLFAGEKADVKIGSGNSGKNFQEKATEPEVKMLDINFCLQSNVIEYADLGLNENKIPLKLDEIQVEEGCVYTYTNSTPEIFEFDENTFEITPLKSGVGKLKLEVTQNSKTCGSAEVIVVVNDIVETLNINLTNFEVKESLQNAIVFDGVFVLENYFEGMERFLKFNSNEIFVDKDNIVFCNKGQCVYIPFSLTSTDTSGKVYNLEYENIFNNFYSKIVFEGEVEIKVEVTGITFKANDKICDRVELYRYNLSPENKNLAMVDGCFNEAEFSANAENFLASSDFDFEIENTNIAALENGKIVAKAAGQTKLLIMAKDGSDFKKEIEIFINELPISSIKFDTEKLPKIIYIDKGSEGCLLKIDAASLTIEPAYLENLELYFEIGNKTIADVFEIYSAGKHNIKVFEQDTFYDKIDVEIKVVDFHIETYGESNGYYKFRLVGNGFDSSRFVVYGKNNQESFDLMSYSFDSNYCNLPTSLGYTEFRICFSLNEEIYRDISF